MWLRRAIFQIHLWLGIILALYSVVIGISGSVLVFRDEISEAMYGQAADVVPSARTTSIDAAVKSIAKERPQWAPVGLRDMQSTHKAAMLLMRPVNDAKSTQIRYVYFNQWTGQVVHERLRYGNLLGWFEHLHLYLLTGKTGLLVSGWMAIGLLLLCLSGLVVWWPGVARCLSALVLHRRGSWKRFNWDLHSVVGFWSSFALTAIVFTGVYFAFPIVVGGAIVKATGGNLQKALAFVTVPKAPVSPPGTPILTIDAALVSLNQALKPAPSAEYLQFPAGPQGVYGAISYYPGTLQYTEQRRVAIDPHTGAVLSVADSHQTEFGMRVVRYLQTIHFGTFGGEGLPGIVVRCIWVLIGLTPALLAVTGLIMYWNRKLKPMLTKARRS